MTVLRMLRRSRQWRRVGAIWLGTLLAVLGYGTVSQAAAPMILNHDDSSRLIDATSAGSGAQFTYDANYTTSLPGLFCMDTRLGCS